MQISAQKQQKQNLEEKKPEERLLSIQELTTCCFEQDKRLSNILMLKIHRILDIFEAYTKYKRVYIAYSGGIDSAVVAKIAHDALKQKAIAITAISASMPESEKELAQQIAQLIGIEHITLSTNELNNENYIKNTADRCYFCKTELYTRLSSYAQTQAQTQEIAIGEGSTTGEDYIILDGTNLDDMHDYRPGTKAAKELAVESPLQQALLTKEDVRTIAKALNLPIWNKPASPCLSSRIAYGENISEEKLKRIELAENAIKNLGIAQVRVRYQQNTARIEIDKNDFIRFLEHNDEITSYLKQLGFHYVALDLEGYRKGSLNIFHQNKKLI